TVEQSHIAHVIAYSLCVGPYNKTNYPSCRTNRGVLVPENSGKKLSFNFFMAIFLL
ncbi:unnamed protein product, partial [Brachionus calyciflorus]